MNSTTPSSVLVDSRDLIPFTCSQIINLFLGLPVQGIVIWLILFRTGTCESSDIFFLNQAVAEILYCLSAVLFVVYMMMPYIGQLYTAKAFFDGFLLSGRPLFQMCVCMERYLAVLHPTLFLRLKPLRYRVSVSALVWLLVLGICLSNVTTLPNYPFAVYGSVFLFVFTVDVSCCVSVIWALKRPGPADRPRETGRQEGGRQAAKQRAAQVILINCLTLIVQILPIAITFILLETKVKINETLGLSISVLVIVVAGFIQPLIYIYRAGKMPFIRCFSKVSQHIPKLAKR